MDNIFPNIKSGVRFIESFFEEVFLENQGNIEELVFLINDEFRKSIVAFAALEKPTVDIPYLLKAILKTVPQSMLDAKAIFDCDPAAGDLEEVINIYPGFFAISIYRVANQFWKVGLTKCARIISEHVHSKTGIDIHPAATIGNAFAIDHGTGIVIGQTTVIGDRVKIYQGVTLGALQVSKSLHETKRHPTIENDVIIYSNATILGGETVIGHDTIIGGNVWVTKSIPPNSMVFHKNEIVVRDLSLYPEAINFCI